MTLLPVGGCSRLAREAYNPKASPLTLDLRRGHTASRRLWTVNSFAPLSPSYPKSRRQPVCLFLPEPTDALRASGPPHGPSPRPLLMRAFPFICARYPCNTTVITMWYSGGLAAKWSRILRCKAVIDHGTYSAHAHAALLQDQPPDKRSFSPPSAAPCI